MKESAPSGPPAARGPKRRGIPYWLKLAVAVLALGGVTVAFVLVVLPQRYVFQSGMRASGVSFPAEGLPFRSEDLVLVEPEPPAIDEPPAEDPPPPPPGPAETLWAAVGPLMEEGRHEAALPHFEEYLAGHPDDQSARMEYAIALVRAGEWDTADALFREVISQTEDRRARLERARLLRERESWDEALGLYASLAEERPGDLDLRVELARTLAQAGEWTRAEEAYRQVLAADAGRHDLRLELAGVLWSQDRPDVADYVAAGVPEDAPERAAAEEIRARLAALSEPVEEEAEPEETDLLVRALASIEADEAERVEELYRADRAALADDPERLLAWADLFQYRLEDMERARTLLEERAALEPPTPDLRLRLAHLYVWNEMEREALEELELAVAEDPELAEAWALLGDVRRWWDERPESAEAYARAEELDPTETRAIVGRDALDEATTRAVAGTERPGFGPALTFFRDSEGFRRLDLTAHGTFLRSGRDVGRIRSGFRRLEGFRTDGSAGLDEGLFAEVDLARWWREGTVRASLTVGAERLDGMDVQPLFGAGFLAEGLDGWDVEASWRHESAYALVTTLESVDLVIHADRLRVAAARRLTPDWTLSAATEAGSLRADGENTWRGGAELGLHRRLAPWLRVGASSRVLGYSDAAPVPLDRPAFWDPEFFWAAELPVELQVARTRGWSGHLRLSPGIGLVRARDADEGDWIPQIGGELGARYHGDRAAFDWSLFHTRGREGDYDALGLSVHLSIRR